MKYLFSVLILIFSFNLSISQTTVLLSEGGQDCPVVDPTNDSRPHMASCIAGLEKHMARGVSVRDLAVLIWQRAGRPECGTEEAGYCPEAYNRIINQLADLNAGYIFHAAGQWGKDWVYVEDDYLQALLNVVDDINNAYDCRGLRRPIIQANLWEAVDPTPNRSWPPNPIDENGNELTGSELANWNATRDRIWVEFNQIYTDVLVEFHQHMTSAEKKLLLYQ